MRKLSLDDTWDYTKRIWEWIAFQKEVLEDGRSIRELKKAWLKENAPEFVGELKGDCFFCKARGKNLGDSVLRCPECPGTLVDIKFQCCNFAYSWHKEPGAFYREILRLDAIRTAVPVVVEHVWVHGDVFRNHAGSVLMYLERADGIMSVNLLHTGCAGTPEIQMRSVAKPKFLFNIEDALSDRGIA